MKIINLIYPVILVSILGFTSIAKAEKKQETPKNNTPTQTCTQQYDNCLGNKDWWDVFENAECSITYAGCLKDKVFHKAPDRSSKQPQPTYLQKSFSRP